MMAPQIDPVIFSLGPVQVRWYGAMYVLGFFLGGMLLRKLCSDGILKIPKSKVDGLVTYFLIGMFIGARTFYVFIYNWDYYSSNLTELLAVWRGGLSFHGAIVGFAVAGWIFAKKHGIPLLSVTDSACTAGAQGIFWGRLGNFINGELYGRTTDSAIGMIFPGGGPYPRHPSQLYEAVGEGVIVWLLLWVLRKRVKHYGVLTSLFICGYAVVRYFIEFFREADAQLGYYLGGTTTMGQILCFIMFMVGLGVYFYSKKQQESLHMDFVAVPEEEPTPA